MFREEKTILSISDVEKMAPSISAKNPSENVSGRYHFIPTTQVIEMLEGCNFFPVLAGQTRSRSEIREGFQKHLIKFRHLKDIEAQPSDRELNATIPEIVLFNSHDGTTAFQFHAGLFRLVCSNGLVVSDGTISRFSVKHINCDDAEIKKAVEWVTSQIGNVRESLNKWQSISLSPQASYDFAERASIIRWGEDCKFNPEKLLVPRRYSDNTNDLWRVFNRIQENIFKGGIGYTTIDDEGNMVKRVTRKITSPSTDLTINKKLWSLAEEYAVA